MILQQSNLHFPGRLADQLKYWMAGRLVSFPCLPILKQDMPLSFQEYMLLLDPAWPEEFVRKHLPIYFQSTCNIPWGMQDMEGMAYNFELVIQKRQTQPLVQE